MKRYYVDESTPSSTFAHEVHREEQSDSDEEELHPEQYDIAAHLSLQDV